MTRFRSNQRTINRAVLGFLILVAVLGLIESLRMNPSGGDGEWWSGLWKNFSTEVIGAILIFGLLGLADRTRSTTNHKQTLIRNARSHVNNVAVQAVEELREHG
jgi:hypothetical protein